LNNGNGLAEQEDGGLSILYVGTAAPYYNLPRPLSEDEVRGVLHNTDLSLLTLGR